LPSGGQRQPFTLCAALPAWRQLQWFSMCSWAAGFSLNSTSGPPTGQGAGTSGETGGGQTVPAPRTVQALTGCANPNTGTSNGDWGVGSDPVYTVVDNTAPVLPTRSRGKLRTLISNASFIIHKRSSLVQKAAQGGGGELSCMRNPGVGNVGSQWAWFCSTRTALIPLTPSML
jgi:hypothetical protein